MEKEFERHKIATEKIFCGTKKIFVGKLVCSMVLQSLEENSNIALLLIPFRRRGKK